VWLSFVCTCLYSKFAMPTLYSYYTFCSFFNFLLLIGIFFQTFPYRAKYIMNKLAAGCVIVIRHCMYYVLSNVPEVIVIRCVTYKICTFIHQCITNSVYGAKSGRFHVQFHISRQLLLNKFLN
jgi:DMSO reductase anchor subunit